MRAEVDSPYAIGYRLDTQRKSVAWYVPLHRLIYSVRARNNHISGQLVLKIMNDDERNGVYSTIIGCLFCSGLSQPFMHKPRPIVVRYLLLFTMEQIGTYGRFL